MESEKLYHAITNTEKKVDEILVSVRSFTSRMDTMAVNLEKLTDAINDNVGDIKQSLAILAEVGKASVALLEKRTNSAKHFIIVAVMLCITLLAVIVLDRGGYASLGNITVSNKHPEPRQEPETQKKTGNEVE